MPEPDLDALRNALAAARRTLDQVADAAGLGEEARRGTTLYALACRLRDERKRRAALFDAQLFGEAAWDILLHLYIARQERRLVNVNNLYQSTGLSHGTAWRWVIRLEEHGLATRGPVQRDRRFKMVQLTPAGEDRMTDYLAGLVGTAP